MSIAGKVVAITGASSGIGRELALLLARNGVRVAVTARSADKLGELCKLAPGLLAAPADVTDPAALKAAYERLRAELGVPDLAVLNAGVWDPMGAGDYTADDVLKRQWLDGMLAEDRDRLYCAFDDRDRVVKMWRNAGVTCLQVAAGEF